MLLAQETATPHGVMEGNGAYNRYSSFQAAGVALALPQLERAVQNVELSGDRPVVMADYGSSQGKNSLAPLALAIANLRCRIGPSHPIFVFHVDQPSNDFNTLFELLDREPDRYSRGESNVFSAAIGRSFYEQVLPKASVHIGWSSYAAVWLSRIPTRISGHFRATRGTESERAAFARQAAEDWERFLSLRALELRPGGCFLVVLPGRSDDGVPELSLETAMDCANTIIAEMVEEGLIRTEERARMVLGSYTRRRCDLLAPFEREGQFQGLVVESCDLFSVPDPAWADYERDGDTRRLAERHARSFGATFVPSLAAALDEGNHRARRELAERLETGLTLRLMDPPMRIRALVQTMVLRKQRPPEIAHRYRAIVDAVVSRSESLGDILQKRACERGQKAALICNNEQMCYRDLDQSTSRLARWFIDQGLKPGDRVAVHWPNSIETVQILFAIFKAGLIAVPINLRLKAAEIAYILEHSQATICFSAPALSSIDQEARASCSSLPCLLTELPALAGTHGDRLPDVAEDRIAVILYTSGTTARPKGVVHTHRTLQHATRIVTEQIMKGEHTVLAMSPIMHASGFGVALLPALSLGSTAVLAPTPDPGFVLDAIERWRCTFTFSLPALMHLVVEEQVRSPRDVSSLEIAIAGGDSVPVRLQERFANIFGVPLQEGIGMTETYPFAFNPQNAVRPGSLGLPPRGVELRLMDAEDEDVPEGQTGEILVRSSANCLGYWNDPVATEALLRGGWLHTGDLARRDTDGYYWFQGRKKEIIICGGSNISPQEVEEVLHRHPAVFEVGVVGAADPVYGQVPVAVVSLRHGQTPSEQDLREFSRATLADYKVPQRFIFVAELPMGAAGKIHRPSLRAMLPS